MVVCRYFLEGRCRFGDRCFNDHGDPGRRYDSQPERQRYDSPNRYRNENYENYDRYPRNMAQDMYASNSPNPYSWHATNSHAQPTVSSPYAFRPSRYDALYRPKENQQQRGYASKTPFSEASRQSFATSGNSENKENAAVGSNEIESVKDDMIAWEKGGQWPFSCYFPFKGHPAFPDFEDMSPEELRHEAYEAQKNDTFPTYVASVTEALNSVKQKRELLKNPSSEVKNIMKRLLDEKIDLKIDSVCKQLHFGDIANTQSLDVFCENKPVEMSVEKEVSSFGGRSTFNLGHLHSKSPEPNVESMSVEPAFVFSKPSGDSVLTSFKFSLPSDQPKPTFEDARGHSTVYTPAEDLTKEQLEAFSAPTFVPGKIPTQPPPQIMCF